MNLRACTIQISDFRKKVLAPAGTIAYNTYLHADMAQLVEHHLAKVGVAGSNPVVRSMTMIRPTQFRPFLDGEMAKW